MLTQERLRELFSYDPETGLFARRYTPGKRTDLLGKPVGSNGSRRYLGITIDGVRYKAHRLAWLYVHGEWPPADVDHRNHTKSDNRIGNLRHATRAQNEQNKPVRRSSTSGVTGVYWSKCAQKWQAYITIDCKARYIGVFVAFADAVEARRAAEKKFFGDFAVAA